jgi:hypothetical protein
MLPLSGKGGAVDTAGAEDAVPPPQRVGKRAGRAEGERGPAPSSPPPHPPRLGPGRPGCSSGMADES